MRWIVFCLLGLGYGSYAQTWQLEIKSKVELWNWKLSTQVEKEVLPLEKATIKLIKSGVVVKEMRSAPDGTFSIMIPPNGVFELLVSYPKCNPKKIIIFTPSLSYGGGNQFIIQLYSFYKYIGFNVKVVVMNMNDIDKSKFQFILSDDILSIQKVNHFWALTKYNRILYGVLINPHYLPKY